MYIDKRSRNTGTASTAQGHPRLGRMRTTNKASRHDIDANRRG